MTRFTTTQMASFLKQVSAERPDIVLISPDVMQITNSFDLPIELINMEILPARLRQLLLEGKRVGVAHPYEVGVYEVFDRGRVRFRGEAV
jgi:hypothetical protein